MNMMLEKNVIAIMKNMEKVGLLEYFLFLKD